MAAGASGARWRRRAVARAGARVRARRCGAARDLASAHPRHVLLAALVAGLLAGPRSPPALAAAALAAVALAARPAARRSARSRRCSRARRSRDARLAALDRTALAPLLGREVDVRATLLEHPRERAFGTRVAAVRLRSGPGSGERVLLRAPAHVRWPARAEPGVELAVRGRLRALGPFDAHERRRNAPRASLRARTIRATGRRRGGLLGALDARPRAHRARADGRPAAAAGRARARDGARPGRRADRAACATTSARRASRTSSRRAAPTSCCSRRSCSRSRPPPGSASARACGLRSRSSPPTCRSPAPDRRSSAPGSWAWPASSPRSPAGRRRAGTRCCSPRRSRSPPTRAPRRTPAGS